MDNKTKIVVKNGFKVVEDTPVQITSLFINKKFIQSMAEHNNTHLIELAEGIAVDQDTYGYTNTGGHFIKRKFFKYVYD